MAFCVTYPQQVNKIQTTQSKMILIKNVSVMKN